MKDDQLQTDLLHLKLSYFQEHYQALATELLTRRTVFDRRGK